MKRIHLHIDRLTLDGMPPGVAGDRRRLGAAIERELGRLLGEGGLAGARSFERPRVDGGAVELGPRPTAPALGTQIGRAVHGAIKK